MAHFAQLDENNKVIQVLVIADKDTTDENGVEKEEVGIAFCKSLFGENTKWVKTSYNGKIRGVFAGIGMTYDEAADEFLPDAETGKVILPNNPVDFIDVEEVTPTPALEG